jgi:AraC family transcriptional regulator, transcriptional activator of pobA
MRTSASIPLYREINECHEAMGFPVRSDLPEFHVFTLEETYPATRQAMPPFRRGFYQVTYLEAMGGATMNFESEALAGTENVLIFSPPEQVLSWVCGGTEQGIEETFPFFDPFAVNVLPLTREDRAVFRPQVERLRTVSVPRIRIAARNSPHSRPLCSTTAAPFTTARPREARGRWSHRAS